MRSIPSDVTDLMEAGQCLVSAALWIDGDTELSVWAGAGTLTLDVPATDTDFAGLQAPNLVAPVNFEIGGAANGVEIVLSGVDARLVPLMMEADLRGRDAILYRLYFDQGGEVLMHAEPIFYGTVDQVPIRDVPGGPSEVRVMLEGEGQGASRFGGQLASDQSQRLIDAADTAMVFVSSVAEKTLYWGGLPGQRASGALNDGATGRG